MSSITPANDLTSLLLQPTLDTGQTQATDQKPPPPPKDGSRMEAALAAYAEEQGLDAEAIEELQSQIKSQLSSLFSENSGDPESMRTQADQIISDVLSEYGLDGDAFIDELKASAPPPPPPPPNDETDAQNSNNLLNQQLQSSATLYNVIDEIA